MPIDPNKLSYRIGFPSLSPFYPKIPLGRYLDISVEKYGEKIAIIYADPKVPTDSPEILTFKDLGELTRRLASSFFELGIRKGDRVGVMLQLKASLFRAGMSKLKNC